MKNTIIKYSILFSITVVFGGCASGLQVERSVSSTSWGYKYVSSPEPVRAGEKSQRFEVRKGDCGQDPGGWSDCNTDRERSEVWVRNPLIYPKTDMWFSWSIFIPQDFKSSNSVRTTVGQIHQQGVVNGLTSTAGGFQSFPPLLQFNIRENCFDASYHRLFKGVYTLTDHLDYECITTVDAVRGKWTDIVVHFNSNKDDGILEIFLNGEIKRTIINPVIIVPDYFNLKYGVYRSFVSRQPNGMPTQIVYFDEVRIGKTRMEVDAQLNPELKPVD